MDIKESGIRVIEIVYRTNSIYLYYEWGVEKNVRHRMLQSRIPKCKNKNKLSSRGLFDAAGMNYDFYN